MPMPTFPYAGLDAFRAELHACCTRRADALFELGDALLCTPTPVPSPPHLSLEPVHQRGWAAATPPWPAVTWMPSGCATCWRAFCRPLTLRSLPWT
jgi:hypothetical protein